MENSHTIDTETLAALIGQLTELNRLLFEEQGDSVPDLSRLNKPFLFGFDIDRAEKRKDYGKYLAYMETISSVLREFGIRMGNNGYAYIMDALKIIIDRKSYDLRLKTDVYPMIMAKYHVKSNNAIEHSIRNAINTAYEASRKDPGVNKMSMFSGRPTSKSFLIFAADVIERSMCETLMKTAG